MKENDDLTRLLRDRLIGAEMDVRPGFWEDLQRDLAAAEGAAPRRRVVSMAARRWAAAAAVALVLGAAGLLVWQLPRQESIQDALTQTPTTDLDTPAARPTEPDTSATTLLPATHLAADASATPSTIVADPMPARQPRQTVQGTPGLGAHAMPTHLQGGAGNAGSSATGGASNGVSRATSSWLTAPGWNQSGIWPYTSAQADDDEQVTVHVTVTITELLLSRSPQATYGYTDFARRNGYAYPWLPPTMLKAGASREGSEGSRPDGTEAGNSASGRAAADGNSPWSWRVALGTALPRGDYHAPLTIEVAAQRRLNRVLTLNAGVQYHYLGTGADTGSSANGSAGATTDATTSTNTTTSADDLHILAIPVRLQVLLASTDRLEFYAQLGGTVEKSLNKGWSEDPIRLSLAAGLGLSYRMNDRLALFAEPSVAHHFDTDTQVCSLRTERATNLCLLCGIRMVY